MAFSVTKSAEIRTRINLSRADWARALGVHERTVSRWEDDGADPGGTASEVMRGVLLALEADEADAEYVGRQISLGVGALLFSALTRRPSR